jgi:uncharacterized protein YjbJ (UPF0337 family)
MVTQETLQGNWNEIKGMLRKRWGQLTDNDLAQYQGNVEELAGLIQRKTGESREAIENYLSELPENASSTFGAASEKMKQYARQASDSFGNVQKQAMDQLGAGYDQAQRFVREQPAVSLAVCFGLGLVTGLFVGIGMGMSRRD